MAGAPSESCRASLFEGTSMKTRAAVLNSMGASAPYAESRPLHVTQIELDPPQSGEVLIRIKVAGFCHSDLSVINGDRPRALPIVLGHEASAEVVQAGRSEERRVGEAWVRTCRYRWLP